MMNKGTLMSGLHLFDKTELPLGWKFDLLDNYCTIHRGASPRPAGDPKYFGNGTIPWIKIGDATKTGGRYIESTNKHVNEEGAKHSVRIPAGSLIIANSGVSLGFATITKMEGCIHDGWLSLTNFKNLDRDYLYYCINFITKKLRQMADGTTQPNLNIDIARRLVLPIPPLIEQRVIAHILGILDDKIELNQQMNKTIEAIGHTLFKQWFIDFEFPNDEGKSYKSLDGEMIYNVELEKKIPKKWTVTSLDQTAEFTRGFSYKGSEKNKLDGEYTFITLNSVKEFGGFKREFSYISSDRIKERHFVYCGDIVVANTEQTKTGTLLGYPALVEFPLEYKKDKGIFSHHITKVIPKIKNFKHYLYYHLFANQQNAVKYNTGSVIWALDVNNWSKTEKIILPHKEILQKFESLMEILFLRLLKNKLQIETLSGLRDSILPKLISGKIRIPIEVN